ncbi:peptidase domain-containing ABC transporter [Marivita sp. S0852]|uniref:peptidase domain-containing ABC transporter n=1 Tax=Marivita sp. S0852 TaxID=3373893 RepID=UPI003981E48D
MKHFARPHLQQDRADCGIVSLAIVSDLLGRKTDLAMLKARFPTPADGANLVDLLVIAEQIGIRGKALRAEPAQLGQLRTPAILHFGMYHFVVLKLMEGNRFHIQDPAFGEYTLGFSELSARFTGIVVEFRPGKSKVEIGRLSTLTIPSVLRAVPDIGRRLLAIAAVALVAQIGLFLFPLYIKAFIELILLPRNGSLILPALALAVGVLALVAVFKAFKRRLTDHLVADMDYVLARFLNRLVLRMNFRVFERKSTGTLSAHFASLRSIRQLISDGCIDAVVEIFTLSVLVVLCLAINLWVGLGLLVLTVVYVASVLTIMGARHHKLRQSSILDAIENTALRENLRNIQAIKIHGMESVRDLIWQTNYRRAAEFVGGLRQVDGRVELWGDLLLAVGRLSIVALAGGAYLSDALTLGAFFAMSFYLLLVTVSLASLTQKIGRLWDIDLYLTNISVLALEPQDAMSDFDRPVRSSANRPQSKPEAEFLLDVRGLSYRHAPDLPRVLRRVCLQVRPGEIVSITGPSGAGKSTLLKLLLGLYPVEKGTIHWQGAPLPGYTRKQLSGIANAVMQEDQLFTGTLLQNITSFSSQPDMARVAEACEIACADDFIARTRGGLHTIISGGSVTLSAGERQRLFLARALYRQAAMLVLDEFTGNLDGATEARIFQNLRRKGLTVLMTAHRASTIAEADRVLHLDTDQRSLTEVTP